MKNVMKRAWEIARNAVAKFGGKVKEYFTQSLKLAWAEVKQVVVSPVKKEEKKVSKSMTALKEIKEVFEGIENMNPRKVDYAKSSDIDTTQHTHTLSTVCKGGKILIIQIVTNYINTYNARGADYSINVEVQNGYTVGSVLSQVIKPCNITSDYILTLLRDKGLKI